LFEPADREDLADFLGGLPSDEPVLWLGLGSNVLIRDGGVPGTVVSTSKGAGAGAPAGLSEVHASGFDRIHAEAGVPVAKLARFALERGLAGGEFLAGIPGTVGGALAMNAGAFGGETWPLVRSVETIDRAGVIHRRPAAEFRFGYRAVSFPPDAGEEWFLAAEFQLLPRGEETARSAIRALLRRRAETQPTGQRSCGSVFKNPPGDFAGRLVEAAGLKGYRIGGAWVSERHANFIINDGTARAADVAKLIDHVSERVRLAYGICLEPEVRIVGREGRS